MEAISSPFTSLGRRTALSRGSFAFVVFTGLTCSFAEAQVMHGGHPPVNFNNPLAQASGFGVGDNNLPAQAKGFGTGYNRAH
jgi:hypothetical protein